MCVCICIQVPKNDLPEIFSVFVVAVVFLLYICPVERQYVYVVSLLFLYP